MEDENVAALSEFPSCACSQRCATKGIEPFFKSEPSRVSNGSLSVKREVSASSTVGFLLQQQLEESERRISAWHRTNTMSMWHLWICPAGEPSVSPQVQDQPMIPDDMVFVPEQICGGGEKANPARGLPSPKQPTRREIQEPAPPRSWCGHCFIGEELAVRTFALRRRRSMQCRLCQSNCLFHGSLTDSTPHPPAEEVTSHPPGQQ